MFAVDSSFSLCASLILVSSVLSLIDPQEYDGSNCNREITVVYKDKQAMGHLANRVGPMLR